MFCFYSNLTFERKPRLLSSLSVADTPEPAKRIWHYYHMRLQPTLWQILTADLSSMVSTISDSILNELILDGARFGSLIQFELLMFKLILLKLFLFELLTFESLFKSFLLKSVLLE